MEVLDANSDGMLDRDELPSIHGPAGPDHWPADPNQPAEQGAKAGKAGRGGDERASEHGDLAARTRWQWSLGQACATLRGFHLITLSYSMREARIARARGVKQQTKPLERLDVYAGTPSRIAPSKLA